MGAAWFENNKIDDDLLNTTKSKCLLPHVHLAKAVRVFVIFCGYREDSCTSCKGGCLASNKDCLACIYWYYWLIKKIVRSYN